MDWEASLVFSIEFALRHHVRPRIAWKDEAASRRAAEAVLAHLRLCRYEISQKPPAPMHSAPWPPPDRA